MMLLFLLTISIILNFSSCIPLLYIDLSHTINPSIPFFPSQIRFNFTQRTAQWVNTENSYFYSTNAFTTSEHMGTHIDAPYHFSQTGWTVDQIPLKYLTSINARIIDVSKQCQKNRNYLITIDDVKNNDLVIPQIDENTGEKFLFVLIFYTGWTKYWPDQKAYAGGETDLEFPGLSEQLAIYLINTYGDSLVGVGIDTLSSNSLKNKKTLSSNIISLADYGQTKTYPVHQILAKYNKYGLENLALYNELLDNVKKDLFTLDIFPMKIGNGTGAPCRILARIDTSRRNTNWFGLLIFFFLLFLIGFIVKVIYDFRYNPNKDF
jgi:kynurenine formamidase